MVDLYSEKPSPFGYMNKNGIDSYGVCHNGFSTRDELDYQVARCNREDQLAQQCRNNGITEENYPRYGTSFWGSNSADNYGFGTSNIGLTLRMSPTD